ncbi:MAG: 50S ribosomal protein L16 [Nanoarchaeota archaeon]|nr:50S ribosomal protein L16 [Nanoarchaeota archaeon]
MGLRKANAYSKRKVTPYTRSSKKRTKAFIKTMPAHKIVKFDMGKTSDFNKGKLPHVLTVVSMEKVQIRNNAMESCRQYINKKLDKELGGQYYFKIVPFPHHVQRENKMLTGAGADRMQTGMQLSFGKSMNKAAILKKGSKLFVLGLPNEKGLILARKLIRQINSKIPGKIRVEYENLEKE